MFDILENTVLLEGKNPEEIREILARITYTVEKYKKGQLIFRIDQPANRIGILLKGHIVIEKNHACGKTMPVFLKYPGQVFGEAAVFSHTDAYPCNVISQEDSEVLLISKEMMLNLISREKSYFLIFFCFMLIKYLP